MVKKLINLVIYAGLSGFFWYFNTISDNANVPKVYYSALALFLIYLFFKVVLEAVVLSRVSDNKTKYSIRKATSFSQIVLFLVIFISIWIEDVQALFVAYGLIAAGVAVALSDFFKNIMGGIIILTSSPYRVGDRIEIDGKIGDVIDIGIMYSTLLELSNWVSGDQATGRLITIPNGWVLSKEVQNYTKDNTIMWDEIMIPLTHDSDWKLAEREINKILARETADAVEQAEREIARLSRKYYLTTRDASPSVYIKITDNWIELYVRYVAEVRMRRQTHANLSKLIFEYLKGEPKVALATESLLVKGVSKKK